MIRESTNALEAVGRIIAQNPKLQLGAAIDSIFGAGASAHHKALAASLKSLYGYASTVPGARHGEHEKVEVSYHEAAFTVRVGGAAIAYLVAEFSDERDA